MYDLIDTSQTHTIDLEKDPRKFMTDERGYVIRDVIREAIIECGHKRARITAVTQVCHE